MKNLIFILLLIIIIATIVWWVTSDNFTAQVIDGVVQYNQDSNAFSKFFFKIDCSLVRNGAYDAETLTCNLNQ